MLCLLSAALALTTTALLAQGPPPDAKYVGTDNCKMCHQPEPYTGWSKSAHAQAFDLLKSVGEEKNPECLKCHTTGYGKPGGFVDEASTPALAGVTCEACHGPGSAHKGIAEKITKVPSAKVCAECHQDQNIHPLPH